MLIVVVYVVYVVFIPISYYNTLKQQKTTTINNYKSDVNSFKIYLEICSM